VRGGPAEGTRHDRPWWQEDKDLRALQAKRVHPFLAHAKRKPATRGMLLPAGRHVLLVPVKDTRQGPCAVKLPGLSAGSGRGVVRRSGRPAGRRCPRIPQRRPAKGRSAGATTAHFRFMPASTSSCRTRSPRASTPSPMLLGAASSCARVTCARRATTCSTNRSIARCRTTCDRFWPSSKFLGSAVERQGNVSPVEPARRHGRTGLDQQLQENIYQFEHKPGRGPEDRREKPAAC
jgi:hypothetical protein